MSDFTQEEYLGALFKLKVLAMNKTPISSKLNYGLFNLGLCSTELLAEKISSEQEVNFAHQTQIEQQKNKPMDV